MSKSIFDPNNPNHDLFIVEAEEGPDAEDNMCSMIGDATMSHLQELSQYERQCWEHFTVMGNKNIFSFIPSNADTDRDPHELKVEDLDGYFDNYQVPDNMKPVLEEAIEEERERRKQSEDLYDRSELLIPLQDWEESPGLFTHYDLPTSPKDQSIYCGNTTQIFYDYFPEGHPDTRVINGVLTRMNRDSDILTEKYGDWVKKWLLSQQVEYPYVKEILELLITRLVEGQKDPEEVTKFALSLIDEDWRKQYINQSLAKLANNSIHQLIVRKDNEWEKEYQKGINVLPSVKMFGQILYSKFRNQAKRSDWILYKRIKAKYMPPAMVKGININTCRLGELERHLKVSRSVAVDIFNNRPFSSPMELVKREVTTPAVYGTNQNGEKIEVRPAKKTTKGWLTKEEIKTHSNIDVLLKVVDEKAIEAQNNRSLKTLSNLSQMFIARQKAGFDNFSSKEWGSLWSYYRVVKNEVITMIKETK